MTTTEELQTTLTLTGLQTGLSSTLQTSSGTISGGLTLTGTNGFAISEATANELVFTVVSLTGDVEVDDPPTVTAISLYTQSEAVSELNLDLRWTQMPEGSEVAVQSSTGKLNVARRSASGTDTYGVIDTDAAAGETVLTIEIWVKNPHALNANSTITMSLVSVEQSGGGGPVRSKTLEKLQLNLG